jgi:hypothetical protein
VHIRPYSLTLSLSLLSEITQIPDCEFESEGLRVSRRFVCGIPEVDSLLNSLTDFVFNVRRTFRQVVITKVEVEDQVFPVE